MTDIGQQTIEWLYSEQLQVDETGKVVTVQPGRRYVHFVCGAGDSVLPTMAG